MKEKLIDLSPEVCVANLINIGGIDCYITNSYDKNILEDFTDDQKDLRVEDLEAFLDFGLVKAIGLIYALPQYALQPSSKEKFVLDVLYINRPSFEDLEKMTVEVIG